MCKFTKSNAFAGYQCHHFSSVFGHLCRISAMFLATFLPRYPTPKFDHFRHIRDARAAAAASTSSMISSFIKSLSSSWPDQFLDTKKEIVLTNLRTSIKTKHFRRVPPPFPLLKKNHCYRGASRKYPSGKWVEMCCDAMMIVDRIFIPLGSCCEREGGTGRRLIGSTHDGTTWGQ